ncbi:MAG: hypothetical protein M1828_000950 [Chrysothrix sp. TS-e1954]|nr:MAG: hypothetical protein M1828_000950 [Chrysothrix sp. TS-e1954]
MSKNNQWPGQGDVTKQSGQKSKAGPSKTSSMSQASASSNPMVWSYIHKSQHTKPIGELPSLPTPKTQPGASSSQQFQEARFPDSVENQKYERDRKAKQGHQEHQEFLRQNMPVPPPPIAKGKERNTNTTRQADTANMDREMKEARNNRRPPPSGS